MKGAWLEMQHELWKVGASLLAAQHGLCGGFWPAEPGTCLINQISGIGLARPAFINNRSPEPVFGSYIRWSTVAGGRLAATGETRGSEEAF